MAEQDLHTTSLEGKPKLVSIVLPVYNGARFLRQSIESCLSQTYPNIELIVVDDASTDNSTEIVKSYHDHRIKLVRHHTNRKLPAALNTGFASSCGTYLTWTSHDNYFAPTALAEMVAYLEQHPHVDFVFADEYIIDDEGNIVRLSKNGPVEKLVEASCLGACFLYTHRVYEKLGPYNEGAFLAEDYEYWLRAMTHFTLAHMEIPLHYYRCGPDSLSSRLRDEGVEMALSVRRRILGQNFWRNRLLLSRRHVSAAINFVNRNRRSAAARAVLWGIAFNPACLLEHRVQLLVAELCFGHTGFLFLQRMKHAIRRTTNGTPTSKTNSTRT